MNPIEDAPCVRGAMALHLSFIAFLILGCLRLVSFNAVDPDLWGHVRYGLDILDSGTIPPYCTYSFTAMKHDWINHEILSEILLALVFEWCGISGLLVFKTTIGMAVFAGMWWVARSYNVNATTFWAFALLLAFNLAMFVAIRPQLLTIACLSLMLLLLDIAFPATQKNAPSYSADRIWVLWMVPLIFVAWTNSHGGFVAGLGIMAFFFWWQDN